MNAGKDRSLADDGAATDDLRRRQAEAQWRALEALEPQALEPSEIERLLHDLRVHQVELEAQNEELRQTQEALYAAKARYFDLYEMAPVGYLTVSEQGLILGANLTAADLLGVKKTALLKQPFSRFVVTEHRDRYYFHHRQIFANGDAQSYELCLRHGGGPQIWARLVTTLAWDGVEGGDRCRIILSNVTERKHAEEQASRSQARLLAIFETASNGIVTIDQRGVIVTLNAAAAGMFGYSAQELVGRNVGVLMPAPHRQQHEAYIAAYLSTGKPKIIGTGRDVIGQRKDGSTFPVNIGVGEFREGSERFFTGVMQDISERKQAEAALKEHQAMLKSFYDSSPFMMGVAEMDGDEGMLVSGNAAHARFIEVEEDEIRYMSGRAVTRTPAIYRLWQDNYRRSQREGRPVRFEFEFPASSGPRWVAATVSFLGEHAGRQRFSFVAEDITEQKQAGEQRAQLQRLIEHSSDFIGIASLDGCVTYLNSAGRRMVGLAEDDDLASLPITHYIPAEFLPRMDTEILPALRGPTGLWEGEMQLRNLRSGALIDVNRSIFTIRDSAGEPVCFGTVTHDITQRKRAEAAVRESEVFARSVLNSVSAEIAVLDRDGNIIAVNAPWRRFAGDPAAPHQRTDVGVNYLAVCRDSAGDSAADAMAAHDGILAVLEGRQDCFSLEYPCKFEDGERWFTMTVTPLGEAPGGAVVAHSEITERKRAEDALGIQNRLLEMVAAGMPLAQTLDALLRIVERHAPGMLTSILLLDADGIHLRHGAAPNLPADYVRAIDGMAIGAGQGACGTAAARGEPVITGDIVTDPLWAGYCDVAAAFGLRACWAHPILDAVGGVLGTFAIYYPIPALPTPQHRELIDLVVHIAAIAIMRHREERALRDSEERLSLVMEAAAIGTWDWDLRSGTLFWSPRCLALFGLPPGSAIDYPRFLQCLHPEDREAVDQEVRAALQNHEDYQREMRTVWPDGSLHWVGARGRGYYDAAGQAVRMSGATLDLTERKRVEQQLHERQVEAENYTRLYVANQTIAAIAHELNQPLNAIASYSAGALRLLKSGNPALDKLDQAFEQSAKQALRAGQVIRELLSFLRGEETVTEALDLNQLVRETLAPVKVDSLLEGFKASLDLAEALPKVQANRVQVEKVLVNLIRNGIEAMREAGLQAGAIKVTVRTGANGDFALVTVRDSGPGLTEAAARRVFEPFFTTKLRGLGMGLAISRALIEAHGGELWVGQDAEPGASFHFTLPFARGAG